MRTTVFSMSFFVYCKMALMRDACLCVCMCVQVQEWYVQGLPKDQQSIQNAVLLTNTEKFPFIVDPQAQAIK